jgi:hypothetical protein
MQKISAVRLGVRSIPWLVVSAMVVALDAAPIGETTRLLRKSGS